MNLLFDLDGTLTDSGHGITRCIQHALAGLARPVPLATDLGWCLGPPLRDTFAQLLDSGDTGLIDRAMVLYRERFVSVGMFENAVYPGVREGLARLRGAGHRLYVVTSKPHVFARRILEHFDLLSTFVGVYGSELAGKHGDKVSLLGHVLDVERFDSRPVMIGDRRHDIEGAHAHGLEAVGVLWGYGSRAELEAAGADALVASMPELEEWASRARGIGSDTRGAGGEPERR